MYRALLDDPYIGSYRAFLLIALVSGWWLARTRAKQCAIHPRHIDNIALLTAVIGLAGGRFFSRLFYYPTPLTIWEALKVWEDGGLVFYGSVVFGLVTVIAYSLIRRISLRAILDVLAPSLALGLAFGRIGCFLAGCCWGDVCGNSAVLNGIAAPTREQIQTIPALSSEGFQLAVQFPHHTGAYEQHQSLGLIPTSAARSLPVHPVQLYEAGLAFLLCRFLVIRLRSRKLDGEVFCLFAFIYGWMRFTLELLRADSAPVYFHGITVSQCISSGFIISSVLFVWVSHRRLRHFV